MFLYDAWTCRARIRSRKLPVVDQVNSLRPEHRTPSLRFMAAVSLRRGPVTTQRSSPSQPTHSRSHALNHRVGARHFATHGHNKAARAFDMMQRALLVPLEREHRVAEDTPLADNACGVCGMASDTSSRWGTRTRSGTGRTRPSRDDPFSREVKKGDRRFERFLKLVEESTIQAVRFRFSSVLQIVSEESSVYRLKELPISRALHEGLCVFPRVS